MMGLDVIPTSFVVLGALAAAYLFWPTIGPVFARIWPKKNVTDSAEAGDGPLGSGPIDFR